jgi:hypothetical protein
VSDFQKRLDRLRKYLREQFGSRPGGGLVCVVVSGGLIPEPIYARTDTGVEWARDPGEEIEAFAHRCALAAIEAGASRLIVGGLPDTPMQRELMDVAHAKFMAEEYSDVPPEEDGPVSRRGFR